MGIFTRKIKTHIQSSAQRMTQDTEFMYSSKQALSQYIWQKGDRLGIHFDDPKLSDYYIQASQKALPNLWNKAYNFAKRPNRYHYGLPTVSALVDIEDQADKIMQSYLGISADDVLFSSIDEKDIYYFAWQTLIQDYAYNSKTNEITIDTETYQLHSAQLFLKQELIDNLDEPQSTVAFDYNQCFDRALDYYRLPIPIKEHHQNVLFILYTHQEQSEQFFYAKEIVLEFEPSNQDYLYCTYIKDNQVHWFSYELFSGNEKIDSQFKVQTIIGEFYPRLYVRLNQVDMTDTKDTHIKKSIKRMYERLGMNVKDIRDMMVKSVGIENWGDTRGLYLFNGVAINKHNNSKPVAEYCFRYFKRLYDLFGEKSLTQSIQDNATTTTLSYMALSFESKLGQYKTLSANEFLIEQDTPPAPTNQRSLSRRLTNQLVAKLDTTHILIAQYNGYYEIIKIRRLYQHIAMSGFSAGHIGFDENLVIPIDRVLIKDLTQKEKELLCHQSLHIQLMFVKQTKQKWYETAGFKIVLAVVAIAVTVAFAPAGASFTAILKSVAVNTLKTLLINQAVNFAIGYAVEQGWIDPKYAGVISFLITLGTMAYGVGFDLSKLTTAPNLMKLTNSAFDAYGKYQIAQIQEVHKRQQELAQLQSNRQEILNQAQKLLDTKVFNPSQELLKSSYSPSVDLFDSPELFYNRQQVLDINELSLVSVYNYVEFVKQKTNQRSLYHTQDELDFILL